MTSTPLFDRFLLRTRLKRALSNPDPVSAFLMERVIGDCLDRLMLVNRTFDNAVEISGWLPDLADALPATGKVGSAYRLAPFAAIGWPAAIIDDEALPLRDAGADLIISLLALQNANDVPGILAQVRRALRPDGLFLAALIGGDSLAELRTAMAEAEIEIAGGLSPRLHPLMDVRDCGALLQRAGFALPVTDSDRITVRYGSMLSLVSDLRAMGATNMLSERARGVPARGLFLRAAEIYAERFSDEDGRIRATFEIVWLSGWVPHESQQKPLRPGSATARLADALGTTEIPAKS